MMKTKIILLLVLMATILSSCLVKSLHPFYKPGDIIFEKNLLGTFLDSDSTKWEFRQLKYAKNFMGTDTLTRFYKVKYINDENDSSFLIATLFRLRHDYYLDFFPLSSMDTDSPVDWHWIPAHSLAKIYIWGPDNFTFFWYDEDWLNELFEKNRVKISHEVIQTGVRQSDKEYILTASTDELQKFIRKYGDEHDILKNLNQKKVRNNKDKEFVFNFINDWAKKNEEGGLMGDPSSLLINMIRTDD